MCRVVNYRVTRVVFVKTNDLYTYKSIELSQKSNYIPCWYQFWNQGRQRKVNKNVSNVNKYFGCLTSSLHSANGKVTSISNEKPTSIIGLKNYKRLPTFGSQFGNSHIFVALIAYIKRALYSIIVNPFNFWRNKIRVPLSGYSSVNSVAFEFFLSRRENILLITCCSVTLYTLL